MSHVHEDCGSEEKAWLPVGDGSGRIARHPHCVHCGAVRNLSSDRARGIGYFMNVLGEIRKGGKLTQVQVRLIAKELEGILSFEDKYDMRGSSQEKMFVDAVMGHSSLSWNFVKGYLQA